MKAKKQIENPCTNKYKCKTLVIQGTRYRTLLTSKFENRKTWQAPDPSLVLSYIPGTIVDVFVTEGQAVQEGQPLVTLEAMKMRNIVVAHRNGLVHKVNVVVNDRIPKGHLIVKIDD